MTSVADMLEQFLNKGGRELIFFQFKKFPVCYNNFCAIWKTEEVEDNMDPEITNTVQKRVFTVEKKPLKVIPAKWNYNCDPWTVNFFHTNMCEIRVHFWRNGLTPGHNLGKVDYIRDEYVSSSLLGWAETIDNIHLVRPEYIVYKVPKWNINRSLTLRLEPKSVPCL